MDHIFVQEYSISSLQEIGVIQGVDIGFALITEDKLEILVPVEHVETGRFGDAFPPVNVHDQVGEACIGTEIDGVYIVHFFLNESMPDCNSSSEISPFWIIFRKFGPISMVGAPEGL